MELKIKKLRIEKGLSQTEIGNLIGMKQSEYGRIENNNHYIPKILNNLYKFSMYLNLDFYELIEKEYEDVILLMTSKYKSKELQKEKMPYPYSQSSISRFINGKHSYFEKTYCTLNKLSKLFDKKIIDLIDDLPSVKVVNKNILQSFSFDMKFESDLDFINFVDELEKLKKKY